MRQGEPAVSFSIITSGRVEIRHTGPDGQLVVTELSSATIVGEIALLRDAPRTATVIAKDDVRGYVGRNGAFDCMLAMPVMADRMVRTARQRLAAYITPIPVGAADGAGLSLRALRGQRGIFAGNPAPAIPRWCSRPSRAYLFEVDYVDHFVWVVTDGVDGPVIADARFIRDQDHAASAEVALTVADAYQGRVAVTTPAPPANQRPRRRSAGRGIRGRLRDRVLGSPSRSCQRRRRRDAAVSA
jgi:protein lysine acetyltransferase